MHDLGTPPPATPAGASAREGIELEVRRVVLRLGGLGPARVQRPGPDGVAASSRVRDLLQHLADLSADAEGQPRRAVPRLAPHALGDQLVVLARDVLATTPDEAVADDVHDRLVQLRRAL